MENLRGSLLMVAAMLGFAFEDMFIKAMTQHLPVGQVLTLVGTFGALIFAGLARARGVRLRWRELFLPAVAMRNLSEMLGTICFVCAIAFTPLAQASAIQQATPLAVTLGAALFLGEKVGWRRWTAIAVGFIGVLIVVRPGTSGFSTLSLLAVASVVGLAVRDVVTRLVPPTISSLQLATYGFASIAPTGLLLMLVRGEAPVWLSPVDSVQVLLATLCGVSGYYALIGAMRMGEIAVITPFRYSRLIFAVIIGWAVFGEQVDGATLLGGAVIVGSGLYTLWRQSVHSRQLRARAEAAARQATKD